MGVFSMKSGEVVLDQKGCRGIRLFEHAGNEYVLLEIEPGHVLPIPVDFCVLKGAGTVTVSGEEFQVLKGQMVSCPPDVSRGWKNETSEMLEVLVIKSVGD